MVVMVVMVKSISGCLQSMGLGDVDIALMVLIAVMGMVVIMVITMVMMMVTIMWWLIGMMSAPSKAVGRREILTMGHYAPFMEATPLGQNRVKFSFCISHLTSSVH